MLREGDRGFVYIRARHLLITTGLTRDFEPSAMACLEFQVPLKSLVGFFPLTQYVHLNQPEIPDPTRLLY